MSPLKGTRADVAAVAIVLLVLVGCGEGASPPAPGGPQERGTTPVPRVTTAATVRWLLDVARSPHCAPTRRFMHPLYGTISDADCEAARARLRGAVDPHGRAYGTAMVIDFRTEAGDRRSAVLALDGSLAYRLLFVLDTGRSTIDTRPAKGAAAVARRVVRAIALGDCGLFLTAAHRGFGIGDGSRRDVCARLPKIGLTRALMAHPGNSLDPLGGNRVFVFYGLRLAPGVYYTIVMAREPAPPGRPTAPARYGFVTGAPSGETES